MKSVEMFRQEKENKKSEAASYLCVCVCVLRVVYFFSAWLANVHVSCDVFLSPVLSDYVLFVLFFFLFFFKIRAACRRSATFSSR